MSLLSCAAGDLCKVKDKPIPTQQVNNKNEAQHKCAGCGKPVHGMGDGCAVEVEGVKDQLDLSKMILDSSRHIICNLCVTSNKKDDACKNYVDEALQFALEYERLLNDEVLDPSVQPTRRRKRPRAPVSVSRSMAALQRFEATVAKMDQQQRNTFYTTLLGIHYTIKPLDQQKNKIQTQKQVLEADIARLEGQKVRLYSNLLDDYTKRVREKEQAFTRRIETSPVDSDTQQLQLQHNQFIAARKEELARIIHQYQSQIQQQINEKMQLKFALTHEYESLQTSVDPPLGYEQCIPIPSAIPGSSSGYLERARTIKRPLPYNHENLIRKELRYRRVDIKSGRPTVNGRNLPHSFTVDFWNDSGSNSIKLFEDDPRDHASDQKYATQVGRDKYIMEWIIGNGKVPFLLRYLHQNPNPSRVPNLVPDDLIIWLIEVMVHTDFFGESNSVVVLVSIGPVRKFWYPRIRQYAHTFPGRVFGFELYEVDGKPTYNIVNYSIPTVLHSLMNCPENGDMSTCKYVFLCLSHVFILHTTITYCII